MPPWNADRSVITELTSVLELAKQADLIEIDNWNSMLRLIA